MRVTWINRIRGASVRFSRTNDQEKISQVSVKWGVLITLCGLLLQFGPERAVCEQAHRFSVQDDITTARIGEISLSPDGRLAAVQIERASLLDGLVHEAIYIYRLKSIEKAVIEAGTAGQVEPLWTIEKGTKGGGADMDRISHLKWLSDGSGFAFLLQADEFHHRLYLAEVGPRRLTPITPENDDVLGFDIRDRSHFVFSVASHRSKADLRNASESPYVVGTGHSLSELAFPGEYSHMIQRGDLWASTGRRPAPVLDRTTGRPISLFSDGSQFMALSPDGSALVTIQAVEEVPKDWETRFPPPYPASAYGLKAHHQDLNAPVDGWRYVGEWVRIELGSGSIRSLTHAPASVRTGWWEAYAAPAWSDDGTSILLPGTFLASRAEEAQRPCVAIVHMDSVSSECVKYLDRNLLDGFEKDYQLISSVSFPHGSTNEVVLNGIPDLRVATAPVLYTRSSAGTWKREEQAPPILRSTSLSLNVKESFKDPPVIVATATRTHRSLAILDPNPQLKKVTFGEAEPYRWSDPTGRKWEGILYKPAGYVPSARYPLVIQNHGFNAGRFLPSGAYASAFVAQELASAGIMVLQVRDCPERSTPDEGPCNVRGYEAAIRQLSEEGRIDSTRVGVIGFSRTVYYVLELLTSSSFHFKAASITDGVSVGYTNYLDDIGLDRGFTDDFEAVIGERPFGSGMNAWLKLSPVFNLDKVTTPLRVVATRDDGVLAMWEPYACLAGLERPVDLIILNTHEHVLVDPTMRLIAQGGNIDWFRFWLQGYEDSDPAKQAQYVRWRILRDGKTPDAK